MSIPPMPPRPPSTEQPPKGNSFVSIALAGMVAMMICAALSLISFGLFAVALAVLAVVFGFVGLQYLIWGWWLSGALREEEEASSDSTEESMGRNDDVHLK